MSRSNGAERAQRLNAAFDLLSRGCAVAQAAAMLTEEFASAPSVAFTVKVPEDIAVKLRAHAKATGTTIGDVVSRAVSALLTRERRRG